MQATFPENLRLIDQKMKEKIDFYQIKKNSKKIGYNFFSPYFCIGNFLHN